MLDKTKVMIADDHALFRAGLRGLLEETGEFEVVAEASNGEDALKAVRENAAPLSGHLTNLGGGLTVLRDELLAVDSRLGDAVEILSK